MTTSFEPASIPPRPWEPPPSAAAGSIGREFAFAPSMARDPDEFTMRDHVQELLAPLLARLRQGDVPAALRAAERLCRQRPDLALMSVEHARLLLAQGEPGAAVPLLEQVLQRNPQHLEALKLLGFAHLQRGDLPRALALFVQAVRRSPADSFAQINCHALRRRLRRTPEPARSGQAVRPVVATSLPPKGLEVGRAAVQSWLERGFRVLSVNTAAEREQLAPHFPGVEFCPCEETARPIFGKDYQYLDALLDALARTGHPLCGIVNADIILRGEPAAWDQVCAAAGTRFVYGSRVNVQHAQAGHGTLLEPGFDFFFFPATMLPRLPRTGFIMGQPAWDVFLPAWVARCGLPRAFCYSPLALHVEHPVQWDRTTNSRYLAMAVSWFAPELATLVAEDPGCHTYLRLFTAAMAQTLNKAPKAGAEALFCTSPQLDACLAPVDPLYWARDTEETLLLLRHGE